MIEIRHGHPGTFNAVPGQDHIKDQQTGGGRRDRWGAWMATRVIKTRLRSARFHAGFYTFDDPA
ncbi:MAG TPA: hypothetical protein VII39_10095 [Bradyrhizobium sp.]